MSRIITIGATMNKSGVRWRPWRLLLFFLLFFSVAITVLFHFEVAIFISLDTISFASTQSFFLLTDEANQQWSSSIYNNVANFDSIPSRGLFTISLSCFSGKVGPKGRCLLWRIIRILGSLNKGNDFGWLDISTLNSSTLDISFQIDKKHTFVISQMIH